MRPWAVRSKIRWGSDEQVDADDLIATDLIPARSAIDTRQICNYQMEPIRKVGSIFIYRQPVVDRDIPMLGKEGICPYRILKI